MPCCCLNILNLCTKPVCGILTIDQVATGASGSGEENSYSLVLDFLQTTITLSEVQIEGEDIHFDISMLNESFEYTGKIYDSEGNPVSITVGDEVYDCVKFKTVINVVYS